MHCILQQATRQAARIDSISIRYPRDAPATSHSCWHDPLMLLQVRIQLVPPLSLTGNCIVGIEPAVPARLLTQPAP